MSNRSQQKPPLTGSIEAPATTSFEDGAGVAASPNTAEVPATNDPQPYVLASGNRAQLMYAAKHPELGPVFSPRPEFDAEVPADEGTLRERLQTELDRHEYEGDNLCVCGASWDIDGSSDGFMWTIASNRHLAEVSVDFFATELQKARAEELRDAADAIESHWAPDTAEGEEIVEGSAALLRERADALSAPREDGPELIAGVNDALEALINIRAGGAA